MRHKQNHITKQKTAYVTYILFLFYRIPRNNRFNISSLAPNKSTITAENYLNFLLNKYFFVKNQLKDKAILITFYWFSFVS